MYPAGSPSIMNVLSLHPTAKSETGRLKDRQTMAFHCQCVKQHGRAVGWYHTHRKLMCNLKVFDVLNVFVKGLFTS